ncbi:pilus assembly protein TadE [Arthrobacter agilis]|jgi:Flp pilus assembly protein TadG|uniref:Pilus assembly protein TadE n=2 Tax=Arthrobacter agilis TaxID=37921 RepID=A0A2L0UEM5_9MICC|nr:pilus assembly protein TadE [Arthrobacter agilis]
MSRSGSERGSVAVEMAILLPVLILLLIGTMEFGRALNTQAVLNQAARESVRVVAISGNTAAGSAKAVASAPTLNPALGPANITIENCASSASTTNPSASVTIRYDLGTLTGLVGPFTISATAVMLCGG